jgi:alkylation response protein AidB-like acyl-CoA dehydrogenase
MGCCCSSSGFGLALRNPTPSASPTRARIVLTLPALMSTSILDQLVQALAATAAARDLTGGTALRERGLIRESGLLALSVPVELGGAGASWSALLDVVRRISAVDSSLGHVFAFHHLMLATLRLFGTRDQWEPRLRQTVAERLFWGNALNPRDTRTALIEEGGRFWLRGRKSFCSGASDSDRLIVSALSPGGKLIVAAIPTGRAGVKVLDDWDSFGQRQTDSGTVLFEDVILEEQEILRQPGPLGSVFASLRPCLAQLILGNVYLGLAEGAFAEAQAGAGAHAPSEAIDPFVLRRAGDLWTDLQAARLATDEAGRQLDRAWAAGDALTPEGRGQVAVAIALAKVITTRVALNVGQGLFDVLGARATVGRARLDRYWRNARVHTLHDPVDHKLRDLGRHALWGEWPTPSFYS